jgi:hypothetical protein
MKSILRAALIVAAITLGMVALAYQVRSRVMLDVGGMFDAPFVTQFHDAENDGTQTYRWTRGNARVVFAALGFDAPLDLRVRLNGWRPDRTAHLTLNANDTQIANLDTVGDWHVYSFDLSSRAPFDTGDLSLTLASDTFVPKDETPESQDPRALGVAVDWVEISPARSASAIGSADFWLDPARPLLPPLLPTLAWTFSLALFYATLRGIGLSARVVNIGAAVLILALAVGLAFARIFVAPFVYAVIALVPFLAALGFLARRLVPRVFAKLGVRLEPAARVYLLAIFLAVLAFKLGGMFYPQFIASDITFHAHRLEFVGAGNLFFTSELPDAARRVVPYPPALYVFLAPFAAFPLDYEALIGIVSALLDASGVFVVFYLAWKISQTGVELHTPAGAGVQLPRPRGQRAVGAGVEQLPRPRGQRAVGAGVELLHQDKVGVELRQTTALFAALLYAFNPVGFLSYSWGNHTNIFAQVAALYLLAFLVAREADVRDWRAFALTVFLIFVIALAHLGEFLTLIPFLVLTLVFLALARGEQPLARTSAFALAGVVALALAFALYYAEFWNLLVAQGARFVNDFVAGRAVTGEARGVNLARVVGVARGIANELGIVLLFAGLVGLPRLWGKTNPRERAVLSAWLLVALAFALVSLAAAYSARFTLWVAPLFAIAAAFALEWLAARGRIARAFVFILLVGAVVQTGWVWIARVLYAYH